MDPMTGFSFVWYGITGGYTLLILLLMIGKVRGGRQEVGGTVRPGTSLSIIVPFRNEALYLREMVRDLLAQDLSTPFEVIFVNDASTDGSYDLLQDLTASHASIRVIRAKGEGKKDALRTGIDQAGGELIVTADADVHLPSGWLSGILKYYQATGKRMILMPVLPFAPRGLWQGCFALDQLSLQGVTAGSAGLGTPIMASAASLAFEKSLFLEVGGYEGLPALASGDDVFLLHRVKKRFPASIGYWEDRNNLVRTPLPGNLSVFLEQRARWGGKAIRYKDRSAALVSWIVLLQNIILLVGVPLAFFLPSVREVVGLSWLLKCGVDLFFLFLQTSSFRVSYLLSFFLPAELFHILYVPVAAWWGLTGKVAWKGRSVDNKVRIADGPEHK